MPGVVVAASAAILDVLPFSLCKAFSQIRDWSAIQSEYADGSSQRYSPVLTSRLAWQQTRRLLPADMVTLRTFYLAHQGPEMAFWFYDPFESDPPFNYDATSTDPDGRFLVRFDAHWEQSIGIGGIGEVGLRLVELAWNGYSALARLDFRTPVPSGHIFHVFA
jgi:hypothetical protein